MGIKVNLLENGEGIEIVGFGSVYGHEIIKAHEEIYDEKHLIHQKYHIIDKSKCSEYDVTSKDIAIIAKLDKKASKINPDIIVAIIESEVLQFSLTEAWQAHVEDFIFKTQSFTDRNTALEWITMHRK